MTAQHSSVLEENQRLRAKLENLEQVLKVLVCSDKAHVNGFQFWSNTFAKKLFIVCMF